MFFSIIINTHNQHETINRCLKSCLNQNFKKNYEIIVIDTSTRKIDYKLIASKKIQYFHYKSFSKYPELNQLRKVYEEGGVKVDFTDEELLFAAFHHDLGKLGTRENGPLYKAETSDWHRKNQNSMFKHNGELHFMDVTHRALWLLNQYDIKYNEKEMLGIMLADGLYNDATKPYFISYREEFRLKTDLPYVLHWADHMSCRQENKEWEDSKPF